MSDDEASLTEQGGFYASERQEYVIHAKVKNNLILSRVLESHKNVASFCKAHGLEQSTIGQFINMKAPALTCDGEWRLAALRLSDALMCHPGELFDEEQRVAELASNEVFIEATREQAMRIASGSIEQFENREFVGKLLDRLTRRQANVLRMRFYDDLTLEECAASLDVTRERVRQIELLALRRLRKFAGYVTAEDDDSDDQAPEAEDDIETSAQVTAPPAKADAASSAADQWSPERKDMRRWASKHQRWPTRLYRTTDHDLWVEVLPNGTRQVDLNDETSVTDWLGAGDNTDLRRSVIDAAISEARAKSAA